jgi:hypothetical protein
MNDRKDKSPHILNASSNLLGICFVVLTSLKLLKISQKTLIDEFTVIATVLLMASCLLSFLAIRGNIKNGSRHETIADYFFVAALLILFITTILFSLDIIK